MTIEIKEIKWQGPFSWKGYEDRNNLEKIPSLAGIYLWTFQYKDGYLVYCAGITNSTQRRIGEHTNAYKNGEYTVFDVPEAEQGKRVEIWHGWGEAKKKRDEFNIRKEEILNAVDKQLAAFRVFVAPISDNRIRARFEAAIMHNIYDSKEPWAELADRDMQLSLRKENELPIETKNITNCKIYGLPDTLKI